MGYGSGYYSTTNVQPLGASTPKSRSATLTKAVRLYESNFSRYLEETGGVPGGGSTAGGLPTLSGYSRDRLLDTVDRLRRQHSLPPPPKPPRTYHSLIKQPPTVVRRPTVVTSSGVVWPGAKRGIARPPPYFLSAPSTTSSSGFSSQGEANGCSPPALLTEPVLDEEKEQRFENIRREFRMKRNGLAQSPLAATTTPVLESELL